MLVQQGLGGSMKFVAALILAAALAIAAAGIMTALVSLPASGR
jgi:hypothetical protein